MKIALLCRNLHTAGGYVVGINFVRSLAKVAPEHQFMIIAPVDAGYEKVNLPKGSDVYLYRGGSSRVKQWNFDRYEAPKVIDKFKPDIVFALGTFGGLFSNSYKQAVLVDRPQLFYPSKHFKKETLRFKFEEAFLKIYFRRFLKYTQLVFCQTPVARDRFHRVFEYDLGSIKIMPNAVSELVYAARSEISRPGVFSSDYFNMFFLTKFYAHKNLEVLIDVFRKYRDKLVNVRCIITIEAQQHPNAEKFLKNIQKFNLQKYIVNVGPLKQNEIAEYFYNSDVLFFPTLLESFSGTYLEAMHFGVPILTSDLDFARYICGDAALYFNPWQPADIADKILKLKNNPDLKNELIQNGANRRKTFVKTWEQVTTDAIKELEILGS